ncbi:hypothetical protein BJ944DRAFT_266858 [Cunninghamella echinulata]|nr:hypothetical protein BJ944DRAFT_266858 [Cunninghamella echinulata]
MDRQKKIANTLQAYFSDANLLWDKIMQQNIKKDNEGFVPFDLLEKLPRLKAMKATALEIKDSAKEYTLSHLKLSNDENSIGRIKPYIRNKTEELDDWSIYVEGLEKPYHTKETINEFFKQHIGNVSFIRIPKDNKGNERFLGYCFIEFDQKENVQKAIDMLNCYDETTMSLSPPTNGKVHSNLQLRVMTKNQWNVYKEEYLTQLQRASNNIKEIWADYNKYKDISSTKEIDNNNNVNDITPSSENGSLVTSQVPEYIKSKSSISKPENESDINYIKNVIIYVDNIHPKSSKLTIKTLLEQSGGTIAFIKRKKGLYSCYIRTTSPEDTNKIVDYFKQHRLVQISCDDSKGTNIKDIKTPMNIDSSKYEPNEKKLPIQARPISGR